MQVDIFGEAIEEQEETQQEEKLASVFDFLNDITFDNKHIMTEENKKNYNIFVVNKGLSQHADCVLYANELNKLGVSDVEQHYDYLFHSITKRKRYGKWAKKDIDDECLGLVCDKYKVNKNVAKQYLKLMNDEQKQQLKKQYDVGGRK